MILDFLFDFSPEHLEVYDRRASVFCPGFVTHFHHKNVDVSSSLVFIIVNNILWVLGSTVTDVEVDFCMHFLAWSLFDSSCLVWAQEASTENCCGPVHRGCNIWESSGCYGLVIVDRYILFWILGMCFCLSWRSPKI
jgi:hypothetical protein